MSSTTINLSSGDQEVMIAAMQQIGGNLNFREYAKKLYKTEEPTKNNVDSGRHRWNGLLRKIEASTGNSILKTPAKTAATPKKKEKGADKNGAGNGDTNGGGSPTKRMKRKNLDLDDEVDFADEA